MQDGAGLLAVAVATNCVQSTHSPRACVHASVRACVRVCRMQKHAHTNTSNERSLLLFHALVLSLLMNLGNMRGCCRRRRHRRRTQLWNLQLYTIMCAHDDVVVREAHGVHTHTHTPKTFEWTLIACSFCSGTREISHGICAHPRTHMSILVSTAARPSNPRECGDAVYSACSRKAHTHTSLNGRENASQHFRPELGMVVVVVVCCNRP